MKSIAQHSAASPTLSHLGLEGDIGQADPAVLGLVRVLQDVAHKGEQRPGGRHKLLVGAPRPHPGQRLQRRDAVSVCAGALVHTCACMRVRILREWCRSRARLACRQVTHTMNRLHAALPTLQAHLRQGGGHAPRGARRRSRSAGAAPRRRGLPLLGLRRRQQRQLLRDDLPQLLLVGAPELGHALWAAQHTGPGWKPRNGCAKEERDRQVAGGETARRWAGPRRPAHRHATTSHTQAARTPCAARAACPPGRRGRCGRWERR